MADIRRAYERDAEPKEIRFVGDMERLVIGPNDKFVLTCPVVLDEAARERIQQAWRKFAGEDAKLLLADGGMKLGVIDVTVTEAL